MKICNKVTTHSALGPTNALSSTINKLLVRLSGLITLWLTQIDHFKGVSGEPEPQRKIQFKNAWLKPWLLCGTIVSYKARSNCVCPVSTRSCLKVIIWTKHLWHLAVFQITHEQRCERAITRSHFIRYNISLSTQNNELFREGMGDFHSN